MNKQSAESFWSKVKKSNDCWEWQRHRMKDGYGLARWDRKKYLTHRIAAWLSGKLLNLTDKEYVLHRCDNPPCVRPSHLFIGNQDINIKDAAKKKRMRRGEKARTAKFTTKEAIRVRKLFNTGNTTQAELAHRYGVDPSSISRLVRNETYF